MGNSHRTESEVRFNQVRGGKLKVCKGVTLRGTHGESMTVGREMRTGEIVRGSVDDRAAKPRRWEGR